MSSEFSESEVLKDLKNLMINERIRPEPEYECFSKYFATLSKDELLKDEEILHLINSHGVQLKNDVKYWLDKRQDDSNCENSKREVPVLQPENFVFESIADVRRKLRKLPSEWTVIQITKKFSINDISRKKKNETVPVIYVTRFVCGDLAEHISPYSIEVDSSSNSQENIFNVLENLSKMRREYYNLGRTCKKLHSAYYNTNNELMSFITELELYILKEWICLFHGRLEDVKLESETISQLKKRLALFFEKENMKYELSDEKLDIIYQTVLSAHLMKNKDIFAILRLILNSDENNSVNVSELMLLVEDIKMLNLSKDCAIKRATYNPVILILDNEFETVPWEMISPLNGQPVCRISSLHLLYALYKYHQPYIKNGFRTIEIDCTYCLINPGKDLQDCEKNMKEFLKKRIPWAEVDFGKAVDPKDLISKIEEYSAYVYCGHGSGMQYLKAKDLKKAFVKSLILLIGCSSNIPKNCGGRTPHQNNTYTYITNGCPCVIGCIQDVGSADADATCEEILSNLMPSLKIEGSNKIVSDPKEPNVLKALAAGKGVCPKYWSKSAFVARGIPCKTVVGNVNNITVSRVT